MRCHLWYDGCSKINLRLAGKEKTMWENIIYKNYIHVSVTFAHNRILHRSTYWNRCRQGTNQELTPLMKFLFVPVLELCLSDTMVPLLGFSSAVYRSRFGCQQITLMVIPILASVSLPEVWIFQVRGVTALARTGSSLAKGIDRVIIMSKTHHYLEYLSFDGDRRPHWVFTERNRTTLVVPDGFAPAFPSP